MDSTSNSGKCSRCTFPFSSCYVQVKTLDILHIDDKHKTERQNGIGRLLGVLGMRNNAVVNPLGFPFAYVPDLKATKLETCKHKQMQTKTPPTACSIQESDQGRGNQARQNFQIASSLLQHQTLQQKLWPLEQERCQTK